MDLAVERRQNSNNLLRELRMRAQGWSDLQILAALDVLGSFFVARGGTIEGLLQQFENIVRKHHAATSSGYNQSEGAGSPAAPAHLPRQSR